MTCIYCELPIEGTHVGAGDGTGTGADGKFAHPGCYVKDRIVRARYLVQRVKDKTNEPMHGEIWRWLTDIDNELQEAQHVSTVCQ